MQSTRFAFTLLAAATALALTGCGEDKKPEPAKPAVQAPPPPPPSVEIKIGHVGPLTGSIAHLGKDNENGARLAVEEANAKGLKLGGKSVKLELIT